MVVGQPHIVDEGADLHRNRLSCVLLLKTCSACMRCLQLPDTADHTLGGATIREGIPEGLQRLALPHTLQAAQSRLLVMVEGHRL